MSTNYFDLDLRIKRTVPLSDYTLPIALSFAARKGDIDFLKALEKQETDPLEKQRLLDEIKQLENKIRSLKRYNGPRMEIVKELLDSVGLDFEGYQSHEDHLDLLASALSDYHIKLSQRVPPAKLYSLKWEANPDEDKKLHIAIFNGKFDAFTPIHATTGKFLCPLCHKTYLHKDRHGCTKQCRLCHRPGCSGVTPLIPTIKCDCGYYFDKQECYDAHKQQRRSYLSVCSKFHYCYQCKKGYRTDRGVHECGKTKFCVKCGLWKTTIDHKCCWEPPSDKDKQLKLDRQQKYRIIFYDFETVQLLDPKDPGSVGNHWVNYACYSIVCQACVGLSPSDPCTECGPRKRGHFGYQPGDEKESVADRFVDFLFSETRHNNAVAVAHNSGAFDVHFLVGIFLKKKMIIDIVKSGMKIMCAEVKSGDVKIKFKDSFLFMPISLSKLPSAFGFEEKCKGTFPYLYNHPAHYGKVLPGLPPIEYYNPESLEQAAYDSFNAWYEENKTNVFDFDKEMHAYCENDVDILHQGVVKYMQTCVSLFKYNPLVHCLTFAAYSFFIIKHSYMKRNQVGVIPEHGFIHNDIQSELAIKFLKWVEHKRGIEIHHFLRGPEHVIPIGNKKYKVDGYHIATKTVYEILGCFWHGCAQHTDHNTKHPIYKEKTYRQVFNETNERLEAIKNAGYSVNIVWECEIEAALRADKEMKEFFTTVFHKKRLNIRDGFFGGRTQNFCLKAEPDKSKGQWIDHLDVTSMYPSLLRYTPMPVGQPEVITSNFRKITLPLPYEGFYLVDILPPRNLLHPVIPFRVPGKLLFPLCRTCAISQENTLCTHENREERFLHVVVWQKELERALEKGYAVLRVYEIWHWTKWTTTLFRPLMDAYVKIKTEASGPPRSGMTPEELNQYANDFKSETGIELDVGNIVKNPAMRYIAKLGMNSPWGKFGEKPIKSELAFVLFDDDPHPAELDDAYEVTSLDEVGDYMMVQFHKRKQFAMPIYGASPVIAAITTATGRLILYEALDRLQERALYCDTDSVVMLAEPGKDNLDNLRGECLGKWTSELPEDCEISKFVSTGPKVYSYIIRNVKTGAVTSSTKARGISQSKGNETLVCFKAIEKLVNSLVQNQDEVISTEEISMKKNLFGVDTVKRKKRLRAVMNKSLYFSDYSTLPYGYDPSAKRQCTQ